MAIHFDWRQGIVDSPWLQIRNELEIDDQPIKAAMSTIQKWRSIGKVAMMSQLLSIVFVVFRVKILTGVGAIVNLKYLKTIKF